MRRPYPAVPQRAEVRPLILWRLSGPWPGSRLLAGAGRKFIGLRARRRGREQAGHAAGASASSPSSRSVW